MSDLLAEARAVPPYDGYTYGLISRLADELEKSEARYREAKDVADCRTKASLNFLHERNEALAAAKVMREALEFYADPKTHEVDEANGYLPDVNWPIVDDSGKRARKALAECGGGK
jgi:hypothetical protein